MQAYKRHYLKSRRKLPPNLVPRSTQRTLYSVQQTLFRKSLRSGFHNYL